MSLADNGCVGSIRHLKQRLRAHYENRERASGRGMIQLGYDDVTEENAIIVPAVIEELWARYIAAVHQAGTQLCAS